MSAICTLELSLVLHGTEGTIQLAHEPPPLRWSPTVGKRESVSLTTATFTALSPPTGAKLAVVVFPATAASISLKSVTGDGGIPVVPASGFTGAPLIIPLGATPSIGLLNAGATVAVDVYWV